jgi:hypothetical protein
MSAEGHNRTHALQQIARYSITSSARNRIDVGNSMPMAFAVLRFTADLNLADDQSGSFAQVRLDAHAISRPSSRGRTRPAPRQ